MTPTNYDLGEVMDMGQDSMVFWIVAALALGMVVTGIVGAKPPLRAVETVDLSRYVERWYAIAHIPTSFERACAQGTTATYTLLPNGQIEVLNECFTVDGLVNQARERAWLPAANAPGKLKVSFVSLFGLRFFPADYWVIDLAPDYSYAVVGHPSRSYGWILSRTPTLPEDVLAGIRQRLEAQSYNWARFRVIAQRVHNSG